MATKPKILDSMILTPDEAAKRGFKVEELQLEFSNGKKRNYWRIPPFGRQTVLIVPIVKGDTVLLIREYSAGLHEYQLQLPKGAVESGETILEAANRELKEEIGKGSRQLQQVNNFAALPGFMSQMTEIILAEDLYDERLAGDEPEELEVVPWSLSNLFELSKREDCTESRSIAALYYVREYLKYRE